MNGRTSVFVPPPMVAAMRKIIDTLRLDNYARVWDSTEKQQKIFLCRYYAPQGKAYDPMDYFSPIELKSFSDTSAAVLNKILADNGFDIRLNDFGRNGFGVVSILDVLLDWMSKGYKETISYNNKDYPGVKMESGFEIRKCGKDYVAAVKTKGEDIVYMMVADKPYSGLALADRIDSIAASLTRERSIEEGKLYFPMINAKIETDISWMNGMPIKGTSFYISQALQQTKIKMNEVGARVKSAVAMGVRYMAFTPKTDVRIDKPFFMWMERKGMRFFYGYFDENVWKDPQGLEMQ